MEQYIQLIKKAVGVYAKSALIYGMAMRFQNLQ